MDREFFFHLGAYDPEILHYGAEHVELSFRVWMCGGSMEHVPCSHMGHVYVRRQQCWHGGLERNGVKDEEEKGCDHNHKHYRQLQRTNTAMHAPIHLHTPPLEFDSLSLSFQSDPLFFPPFFSFFCFCFVLTRYREFDRFAADPTLGKGEIGPILDRNDMRVAEVRGCPGRRLSCAHLAHPHFPSLPARPDQISILPILQLFCLFHFCTW